MSAASRAAATAAVTRRRLFFALWPDQHWCARLQTAMTGLLASAGARALAPDDWHVTLCFLGSVDPSLLAPLQARAAQLQTPAFALVFERVRYWREARVIAAMGTAPPEALGLAQALRALARELGLAPDEKPLRPHVTLMRSVSAAMWRQARASGALPATLPERAAPPELMLPPDLLWRAEAFCLAESVAGAGRASEPEARPSRYLRLARWPLRGSSD